MTRSTDGDGTMDVAARPYPFERGCPFAMPAEFGYLREHQPVARVTLAGGEPAWLVTRFADVRAALADPRLRRTPAPAATSGLDTGHAADPTPVFAFGGSIAEPPGHTRWRRIVNRAFTQRQADALRPRIRQHVDDVLAAVAARGGGFDVMADVAYELPFRVICELLGVPDDNRGEFMALAHTLTRRDPTGSPAAFGQALAGVGRYAVGLISAKRRSPGADLLSTLVRLRDDDDSVLSTEELVATVVLLLLAGYESTAVQLGNAVYALLGHPGQLRRLRDDPALIGPAVEELLRYAQLGTGFAVAKFPDQDVTIAGVAIPAGATVFLSIGSADRDAAVFGPDAEELDLARTTAARHIAFSAGPHHCLGAALARAELQEGIAGLLRRFPGIRSDGDLDRVPLTSNLFTFYPAALPVAY